MKLALKKGEAPKSQLDHRNFEPMEEQRETRARKKKRKQPMVKEPNPKNPKES